MAFNFTSYGDYFRSSQNPVCRIYGPTGPPGSGATGATGPAGPAGNNGISTGLIYYFHAQGPSGQPDPGYTGFVMNTSIRDGPVGGNPIYPQYNGYFSNTQPTAGTTGPVLLGRYQTSSGDPGVTLIPPGSWSFVTNIYTGIDQPVGGATGLTGTTGSYINVYAEVWKTSQGISSLIGTNKDRAIEVKSAVDDSPYIMGVNIKSPGETLFTPTVDSMFVNFYAVPSTSTFVANQRIEFWTDGDSLSQVTTTLPAKSGNSGPTGPVGPSGPQGLPGANGSPGSQGIQGPMGQSTWTPVLADSTRILQSVTTSGVFTKIDASGNWNAGVRSAQAYSSGAYVSFNTPSTPSDVIIGLSDSSPINTIPPPNTHGAITYGINYTSSNTWYYIENGAVLGAANLCVAGDSFSIIYDGVNVKYYQNGVLKRTVPRAIGLPLHLESNFIYIGGTTSNLVFGPAGQSSQIAGYTYYPYNSGGTYTPITIPANVMSLDAILIGGGGGGGGGGGNNSCGGGGGGAGFFEFLNLNPGVFGVTVLSGQTITYAVGAGGIGNSDEGGNGLRGQDGGSTWITINGITYEAPGGQGAGPGNGGGGGGGGGQGGSGGGGGGGSVTGGIGGYGQMTIYDGYNGTTTDIKGGIGGRSPFGTNFFTLPRPVKNPAVNGGCGGGWLGGWSNTTGAGGASSSKGYDGFGSGGGGRNATPGPGGISPEGNNGGNGGVYIRYIY